MGAFPRIDGHIEITGHVGDLAEQREIRGSQDTGRVGLDEEVEGLLPVPTRGRGTGALDNAKTGAIAHRCLPNP